MPERFPAAAAILRDAIGGGAFPAASRRGRHAAAASLEARDGTLTYEHDSEPVDGATIFDLASLTKVIATDDARHAAVDDGRLALDDAGREMDSGMDAVRIARS